jgi:hypothetical protein
LSEVSKSRQPFPTGTPTRLTVVSWADPVVEARGHKPGSPYVELVWLGVLGPATVLCWSRLSRIATARPGTVIDTADLAVSLGLSKALGRNAPITSTLNRMVMFGTANGVDDTLSVRRALPDVPPGVVRRLSYTARLCHQRWARHEPPAAAFDANFAPDMGPSVEVSF